MPRPAPTTRSGYFVSWKQRLWHELHARAAATVAAGKLDPAHEARWLAAFTARIPCQGCRAHWRGIIAAHPPDLASPARYFRWTVQAHNAVNSMLEKPALPFARACQLHGLALTPADL